MAVLGVWGVPAASQQATPEGPWPMAGGGPAHPGTVDGPAPPYRVAWDTRIEDGGPIAGPVVGEDLVVVVSGATVVALSPDDGTERWSVSRAKGAAGPAAVLADVVVYGEGRGGEAELVGADPSDGTERWSLETGDTFPGGVTAVAGRVFVLTRNGTLWAVDAAEGEEAWSLEAEGRGESVPAVSDGRVFVTTARLSEREAWLSAIDAETGERIWRFAPEEDVVGLSSATVGDDLVYLGVGDRTVRAVAVEDGRERWSEPVRAAFAPRMMPALPDDLIMGDAVGDIYRMDPRTGEQRWDFRVRGSLLSGAPAVSSGAVVVGDDSGRVSAIDLDRGLLVWSDEFGEDRLESVAVGPDRIYVASRGGRVIALEHDPQGTLLEEPSPTTLFPGRALLNFAAAAAIVVAGLLLLFRVPLRMGTVRGGRSSDEPTEDGS